MTRGKKVGLLWLAAIVLLVAIIWTAVSVKDYFDNLKYKPVLNPNPQYFMTIEGHINPDLIGKVQLKWTARYSSSDKRCDVTYDTFEGIVGWRWVDVSYVAKPSASGDYKIKIPFDYYKPGYCGWQISEIDDESGVDVTEGDGSTLVHFYPCGDSFTCNIGENAMPKSYQKTAHVENACRYKKQGILDCEMLPSSTSFSNTLVVPRDEHYQFYENYALSS